MPLDPAMLKGGLGGEPDGDGADDYNVRLEVQMGKLIRALKSGNEKAAAQAFRAAHEECSSNEEPDGDEADTME